ncbi:DEAD/DEAH box helicase [Psychrosphaera aquimarina]|uniref:DEAD/DEAH box helicase n=1 Tax=Psychrosphaera aquimarina TaxID=2044854 RepID=A0ABU3QWV1_9GAMM|nr:DEAD/DEAH box helicase [Psychrosphaera aquimarina]MDU0111518.1 DEAD/DEAH box helicase [Psychrosphaera aquimarina]
MSFNTLGLHSLLLDALTETGYDTPTDIQAEAIPHILNGGDVMAGAQTGTGKTAAFTLPILHKLLLSEDDGSSNESSIKRVKALILTPTRELAQQVHKSVNTYANKTTLKTALVYGGVSIKNQIDDLQQGVDIVIATPGRLLDHLYNQNISLEHVEYVVFDEADRMLDMGFKDEISRITKKLPSIRQTLLFSATFDESIFKLSKRLLNDAVLVEVNQRNAAATTVEQVVYNIDEDRKRELISHLIGSKNWHQVLIFTRTKQDADALAKEMKLDGIKAESIHGDKSQGARERVLEQFKTGTIRALVATDVAARGLDIQNLNYVINYQLPYIAEDYIHRIGRTGRAGNKGLAISLLSVGEEYLLEEVEAVLDTRLLQQWLPGYEPDLTKKPTNNRKNTKSAQKQRAGRRAAGKRTGNRSQAKR